MNWFELNLTSHILKVLIRDFRRKNLIKMDEQACTCWQTEMQITFYWTWMCCWNFAKAPLRDKQGAFTFSWQFSMERAGWKSSVYFRRDWVKSVSMNENYFPKFYPYVVFQKKKWFAMFYLQHEDLLFNFKIIDF